MYNFEYNKGSLYISFNKSYLISTSFASEDDFFPISAVEIVRLSIKCLRDGFVFLA